MQLSVIVPTCRRPHALVALLARLTPEAQGMPSSQYEVIVSDDAPASAGGRAPRERFPHVRFVDGPGLGPAANRNCGARHANGKWLVFIDDDCVPTDGWLRAIAAAAEGPIDVVEGKIVAPDKRESLFRRDVENLSGSCYWSANLALRRELFERLGGFDEDFPQAGGEDMEFAHRLQRSNASALFCPDALIFHPSHVMSWRGVLEWSFRIRWYALYLLKTGQTLPPEAPTWKTVPHVLVSQVLTLLRRTWQSVRAIGNGRSPAAISLVAFDWAMAPLLVPYFAYWDLRFRRMLCRRAARPQASVPIVR